MLVKTLTHFRDSAERTAALSGLLMEIRRRMANLPSIEDSARLDVESDTMLVLSFALQKFMVDSETYALASEFDLVQRIIPTLTRGLADWVELAQAHPDDPDWLDSIHVQAKAISILGRIGRDSLGESAACEN
jgi:hypothetical protein